MPKLALALLLSIYLLLPQESMGQQQIIKDLRNNYKASKMYFFYPSTLRMLNFNKNPDYFQFISQVDLLVLVNIDKTDSTYSAKSVRKVRKEVEEGLYENLLELNQAGSSISIFLKEDDGVPAEMFGFFESDNNYMVAYMDGYTDLGALMKLVQGDFDMTGFKLLLQADKK